MGKSGQQNTVGFLSFFKLNLLYGLALGQLTGVVFLVMGICGAPVDLNLGAWHLQGLRAGIGAAISLPPAFGIVWLLLAPLVFVPFTIAGSWADSRSPENHR
jgi:hypothetical protein